MQLVYFLSFFLFFEWPNKFIKVISAITSINVFNHTVNVKILVTFLMFFPVTEPIFPNNRKCSKYVYCCAGCEIRTQLPLKHPIELECAAHSNWLTPAFIPLSSSFQHSSILSLISEIPSYTIRNSLYFMMS